MSTEINSKTTLVSDRGGSLDIVMDGEVIASIAVPAGRVSAREYLDLVPLGASIEIGSGLVALQPRSGYGRQAYGPGSHETGANPDYVPGRLDRNEAQMRQMMYQLQAMSNRLERREAALATVERIPSAPVADPAPVIEPIEPAAQPVAE